MKLNTEALMRGLNRQVLVAKKNSPHIFFAAGIVGIVGSAVLACRATLKLEKELDVIRTDIDSVKEQKEAIKPVEGGVVEAAYTREMLHVYARSSVKIVKLYAPSVALGAASVAALTGSHVQMTRRNAALSATLTLVTQAFDEYRDRVREEIGEERERQIYHCMDDNELESGEGSKALAKTGGNGGMSPYARVFDESSTNWQKNPEMNRIFVELQQKYANHRLNAYGHVFLNEVYDMLDLPRTTAGAIVGWVRHNPNGDNYIDFGLYEQNTDPFEPRIWLDFNVDGVIYEMI